MRFDPFEDKRVCWRAVLNCEALRGVEAKVGTCGEEVGEFGAEIRLVGGISNGVEKVASLEYEKGR